MKCSKPELNGRDIPHNVQSPVRRGIGGEGERANINVELEVK